MTEIMQADGVQSRQARFVRCCLKYVERKLFEISDKIFLVVGDYNPDGKRFYEKLGYMFIGTIPDLYRQGIAENIMMKKYNML